MSADRRADRSRIEPLVLALISSTLTGAIIMEYWFTGRVSALVGAAAGIYATSTVVKRIL